ncbi:MAG: hypothetical protein JSS97_05105 [Actinobacteria bacterium]|nr:hypothetical protein [Actinomycetota bacterium]
MRVPVRAPLRRAARTLGLLAVPLLVLLSATGVALACVAPAEPTTLTTSLSGESKSGASITVLEGTKVKDQATLEGKNAAKATGKISYSVYKDASCKELATGAGEFEFKEGKVPASEEVLLEAGKTYYWKAHYGGDSLNAESSSSCGSEVLSVKAATSISLSISGEGLEGGTETGSTIEVGDETPVTATATLSGTNISTATGTVKYRVYKDSECKELLTAAGEGTVSGSKVTSSSAVTVEEGGEYPWRAEYVGDALHQSSLTACHGATLIADPEFKVLALGTTTLKGKPLPPTDPPATFSFGTKEIKCDSSYTGSLTDHFPAIWLTPAFSECSGWGLFLTALVEPNDCVIKISGLKKAVGIAGQYNAKGDLDSCGATKLTFKVPAIAPKCEMKYESKSEAFPAFELVNTAGPQTLKVRPGMTFSYKVTKSEPGCPFTMNAVEHNGGFTGEFELKAEEGTTQRHLYIS